MSLDGATPELVDLYSPTYRHQQAVFAREGLADAPHSLRIECAGTTNAASTGTRIDIDAVRVLGDLTPASSPWVSSEETDPDLTWEGTWTSASASGRSGGAWRYSSSPRAAVDIAFHGTAVRLVCSKAPDYGKAWVSLDGGTPELVDLYSSKWLQQQVVFSRSMLSSGPHTLRIAYSGQQNAASTGARVNVDAVAVIGSLTEAASPWSRFEESVPAVSWQGKLDDGDLGLALRRLLPLHLRPRRVCGRDLRRDRGAPRVLEGARLRHRPRLDRRRTSGPSGPVRLEVAQPADRLRREGLSAGPHTVRLTCSGTKNGASLGTRVNVDALEIVPVP